MGVPMMLEMSPSLEKQFLFLATFAVPGSAI